MFMGVASIVTTNRGQDLSKSDRYSLSITGTVMKMKLYDEAQGLRVFP